jgi:hypothetical protein
MGWADNSAMNNDVIALIQALDEGETRRTLADLGKRAALRAFDRVCAIRYGVDLLRLRVERPEIRERLMQRYGFSRRTAYNCIDEALTLFCRPDNATVQFRRTQTPQDGGSKMPPEERS